MRFDRLYLISNHHSLLMSNNILRRRNVCSTRLSPMDLLYLSSACARRERAALRVNRAEAISLRCCPKNETPRGFWEGKKRPPGRSSEQSFPKYCSLLAAPNGKVQEWASASPASPTPEQTFGEASDLNVKLLLGLGGRAWTSRDVWHSSATSSPAYRVQLPTDVLAPEETKEANNHTPAGRKASR